MKTLLATVITTLAMLGTGTANADPDSGPQPKVIWVDNVHWTQQADGSEVVSYPAERVTSNLEGDAKVQTHRILEVAHASFPNAPSVTVDVDLRTCDKYGNCSVTRAAQWVYTRATLNRINWDLVKSDDIWDVADSGGILAGDWT